MISCQLFSKKNKKNGLGIVLRFKDNFLLFGKFDRFQELIDFEIDQNSKNKFFKLQYNYLINNKFEFGYYDKNLDFKYNLLKTRKNFSIASYENNINKFIIRTAKRFFLYLF